MRAKNLLLVSAGAARSGRCHGAARHSATGPPLPVSLALGLLLFSITAAFRAVAADRNLLELSLEELLQVEVYSATKSAASLAETPAPVSVITREDVRRSGFTLLPEVLRLVPGLQVARLDASKWALTARGFDSRYADKLLVMIDGRSIYTPLFAGVWWQEHDVLLEDLERIEVVRGPGATLWGANAVNGIVDIITRDAADTQGGLVAVGTGTEERGFCTVRYGGGLGSTARFRVYGKYANRDGFVDTAGTATADRWWTRHGGFRLDWKPSGHSTADLQGELGDGETGQNYRTVTPAALRPARVLQNQSRFTDGFLLGRWQRAAAAQGETVLQLYYDHLDHEDSVIGREVRHTFDLDLQHRFAPGLRQELLWGTGYRVTHDDTRTAVTAVLVPASRTDQLFSAFVQDQVELVRDRLNLILGSKLEHNGYTGFEIQPGVRLLWQPGEQQRAWAAIARAVRTPSRGEEDIRISRLFQIQGAQPGEERLLRVSIEGDRRFVSENLLALETGYRFWTGRSLDLDLAAFLNLYDHLRTLEPALPHPDPDSPSQTVLPFVVANKMKGRTHGLELEATVWPTAGWRLRTTYTYLRMHLELASDSQDAFSEEVEHYSPRHQLGLWSSMNLPKGVELDAFGRYVGALESLKVNSYLDLDVRLGWCPWPRLKLALVGQNLLHAHHTEFNPELINSVSNDVERGVYGTATWEWGAQAPATP